MLAKLGSTKQAIPPGVSLEHLHKPSITPSPDSDSIIMPVDPAGQKNPGAPDSPLPAAGKEPSPDHKTPPAAVLVLTDQPDTADHQLDPGDIQPDPGASQPDPGAGQPDSGATQPDPGANHPAPGASLAEDTRLQLLQHDAFAKYPTPGWARPYLDFLIQGTLPEDEVLARQIQRHAKA